jgi:Probable Zinc-ribbon domain
MTPPNSRKFLFDVRPQHRETLASYSTRLLKANFETEQHRTYLAREHTPSTKQVDLDAAWLKVLTAKTPRNTFHFDPDPTGWIRHPDGSSCESCSIGLPKRALCTLCAHGETITQNPHFDTLVCITHRRWIGLTAHTKHQQAATPEILAAAIQFDKLRRTGRLDLRLYNALIDAVQDAINEYNEHSRRRSEIECFPLAIALANAITSTEFATTFYNPSTPYVDTHAFLAGTVRGAAGVDSPNLARAIWLYARPTVWAVRDSIITRTPFTTAWAHDLHIPPAIAATFATFPVPEHPFSGYLEVTNDDALTAARHGLRRVAAGNRTYGGAGIAAKKTLSICADGHQFVTTPPTDRSLKQEKPPVCPQCRHRVIIPGYNDLATTHPHLAAEFDIDENGGITPQQIAKASYGKYKWRCSQGHSFESTPNSRAFSNTLCPICQDRIVVPGINDLSTTHPDIVREWAPNNPDYWSPTALSRGSDKKIKWLCAHGHQSIMRIHDRVRLDQCPGCRRATILETHASIVDTHPAIAAQWHPAYNDGGSKAKDYTAGSKALIAWQCDAGHWYKQVIERRTVGGYGCPTCSKRRLTPGVNDIGTTHPELASEWVEYMNHTTPDQHIAGTAKYWWRCAANRHKYQQSVPHRVKSKGCPECPPAQRILAKRSPTPTDQSGRDSR